MTQARSTPRQQRESGLAVGMTTAAVAALTREGTDPLRLALAFLGGYAIGSRPIVLTVDESDAAIEAT